MTTVDTSRAFIVLPNNAVDEIDADGSITTYDATGDFYLQLHRAGFPLYGSDIDEQFIDLRVEADETVVAHQGDAEHVMPAKAAEVFLRWFRANAQEEGSRE